MISCLLIHVFRNQDGAPVFNENPIVGEQLRIGRDSACEIHLADHRIGLVCATVQRTEDGRLDINAAENQTIGINGSFAHNAILSPGTRIEIGPCLLLVEPVADGHDLVLSVEMIQSLTDPDTAQAGQGAPLTLAELKWSKRKLGFQLAAGILFLFFLLPVLPSISNISEYFIPWLPGNLTASWNPRPLSGGHGLFGAKCSTCHKQAFQAIANDTCLECHQQVVMHQADKKLPTNLFKNVRCTECHQDHKGKTGLVSSEAAQCVGCHGDIENRYPRTSLPDIRDFDTDHPEFRITLPYKNSLVRVKREEMHKYKAEQGLKMSHKIHMDKKGVSSPLGNMVMTCQDCHKPDESGRHFLPMTMQGSCQQSRCHKMYFEEPVEGKVPHGSVRELMHTARDFHLKWLTDPTGNNNSACENAEEAESSPVRRILDCANRLAKQNLSTLFKKNLNCDMCHETEQTGNADLPWKITPLRIHQDWQPGAIFMHSKHNTLPCTECHDKLNAKTSSEIAMPDLEKCRKCHVGDHVVPGKIKTGCGDCHRFHGKPVQGVSR
ncbi:MAG: cytochrome c3 family protein [Magnetococcales bacterium]|nr:cytochrome c3 family protein [Magnetococcales bacterium]